MVEAHAARRICLCTGRRSAWRATGAALRARIARHLVLGAGHSGGGTWPCPVVGRMGPRSIADISASGRPPIHARKALPPRELVACAFSRDRQVPRDVRSDEILVSP